MVQIHATLQTSDLKFKIFEKMESNSTISSDIYGKVQA